MTKEERKARERAERAEYILDSAERLVFERGFDNVKIDDIAAESGYAKRSVYLYFKDRGSIYFSLVLRGQKLLLSYLSKAAEKISSGGNLIDSYCRAFYDYSLANPAYFELVMNYESRTNMSLRDVDGSDEPEAQCAALSSQYGALILQSLESDMEKKGIKSDLTPPQLLLLLWSQIFGFMQVLLTRKENFTQTYGIGAEELFSHFARSVDMLYHSGFKEHS